MNKKLVALLTVLVLTLSLFSGFAAAETDKNYEFIFVCPIVGLEYWNLCADGIAAADAEFGTSTQIVGPTDSSNFVTEVVTYMESAIATQPDGIFCYAGLESMPRLLQEAADAGIPVVTIDSDCSDPTNRIAYAGTDPYNAGYASGEAMIAATGGEGTVAILTSSLGSEKEQEEIAAFMDAIADTNLEVVVTEETNADLATGVTKMEAIVQTYPDLTAVLGTSAYDVQAAARVKYEYGLDGLKLIGYDDQEETLRYIREGIIDAIIVQDPYTMGYLGVKNLYDYLTTGSVENEHVDTGTITVTIDNVDSYR
ncbi:MAG TPA: substrate-binding domain-containing protein [Candidatus Pullichristensenella avicola]|nr:substrate-binding domain-containing protein [Candidatus Pullichristensenella avicola]